MLALILLHIPDTAINAGLLHSAGLPHTADNSQYAALQVTASLLRCKFCLVTASMLPLCTVPALSCQFESMKAYSVNELAL